MATTPRPVRVMSAVLAGASVLVGGAAFAEVVPRWVAGLAALVVAAVTAGWGRYLEDQVTPWPLVAARRPEPGAPIEAGPAAPAGLGLGDRVNVELPPPTITGAREQGPLDPQY